MRTFTIGSLGMLSVLAACDTEPKPLGQDEISVTLYQFDGQHVRVEACGEVIVDGPVYTEENSLGYSMTDRVKKEQNCRLRVAIEDEFYFDEEIQDQFRYIIVGYNLNEEYVDLTFCDSKCAKYYVMKSVEFPFID